MNQHVRPLIPGFVAEYGPEVVRHILIALLALMLAVPVRNIQDALVGLVHGGPSRPAIAQLWPSRGAAPVELLR